MSFILQWLVMAMAFAQTFAPCVAAMLVAYLMLRGGASAARHIGAFAAATVLGLALWAILTFAFPINLGAPPFGLVTILIASCYVLAGTLGGIAIARRLTYEDKPRTFSS